MEPMFSHGAPRAESSAAQVCVCTAHFLLVLAVCFVGQKAECFEEYCHKFGGE